ncbi:unnamed protein product [Symbiodinium natans]|uniref:Uncharacterized protein n=1 Tax=Symbiodinium natans TaxID=878477 RepID=A0A812IE50_9DINO|nr:unnamed protein product [Symbiodinium natans]CAE7262727.1 unnamed protein product [Symbiodinium natans]
MTSAEAQIAALWGSQTALSTAPTPFGGAPKKQRRAEPSNPKRQPKPNKSERAIPDLDDETEEEELLQDRPNKSLQKLLVQMILRHEFSLQMLEADRTFRLYFLTKDSAVLPQLHKTSLDWKEKHEQGLCDPLRTALMGVLMLELKARLEKTTEEGLSKLCRDANWLTLDNKWRHLAWNVKDQKMLPTDQEPVEHRKVMDCILQIAKEVVKPGLVHRFHSLRPLQDLAATQLVGLRLRQARVKPSKLAEAVKKASRR